ncbi:MAG: NapC/NirT family cytochrome c [Azoarcus sp.]|jgi:cytochrome c-type protein NapC|nr:NapC/NirT family cytochrome c [Azoarcus sp.]
MSHDPNVPADARKRKKPPEKKRFRFLSRSILVAFIVGIVFTAVFNTALDMTNKEDFCLLCHEMKDNVYREYQTSIHYTNRSGVRAVCADCHVPKEFGPKIIRKIQAANEVWSKIVGHIDTPEKFQAKRAELAQNEWRRMKANNSQECRNCHDANSFDFSAQGSRSVAQHQDWLLARGQTCIDCHKGIAHRLPRIDQGINKTDPEGIPLDVFRPPPPEKPAQEADSASAQDGSPEQ